MKQEKSEIPSLIRTVSPGEWTWYFLLYLQTIWNTKLWGKERHDGDSRLVWRLGSVRTKKLCRLPVTSGFRLRTKLFYVMCKVERSESIQVGICRPENTNKALVENTWHLNVHNTWQVFSLHCSHWSTVRVYSVGTQATIAKSVSQFKTHAIAISNAQEPTTRSRTTRRPAARIWQQQNFRKGQWSNSLFPFLQFTCPHELAAHFESHFAALTVINCSPTKLLPCTCTLGLARAVHKRKPSISRESTARALQGDRPCDQLDGIHLNFCSNSNRSQHFWLKSLSASANEDKPDSSVWLYCGKCGRLKVPACTNEHWSFYCNRTSSPLQCNTLFPTDVGERPTKTVK